ncbi:hypothetical protein ABPG72_020566 [Tetrahymena utriculariae]
MQNSEVTVEETKKYIENIIKNEDIFLFEQLSDWPLIIYKIIQQQNKSNTSIRNDAKILPIYQHLYQVYMTAKLNIIMLDLIRKIIIICSLLQCQENGRYAERVNDSQVKYSEPKKPIIIIKNGSSICQNI